MCASNTVDTESQLVTDLLPTMKTSLIVSAAGQTLSAGARACQCGELIETGGLSHRHPHLPKEQKTQEAEVSGPGNEKAHLVLALVVLGSLEVHGLLFYENIPPYFLESILKDSSLS